MTTIQQIAYMLSKLSNEELNDVHFEILNDDDSFNMVNEGGNFININDNHISLKGLNIEEVQYILDAEYARR